MAGSTDQISLNSEAIYSGYQSVNYAKKSMSSLFSLLSANNVDYSLISNLGFDYQSIINNLNEQYNKLTDYSSRLLKVKNILLKADPNNEYLFQQIDLQFIGMDMGDNPSETDLITYFNTMKKVYYTAKGKDINELSDFEKAIIKNYEESGYADFDEYQNLINEISQLKGEYSELNKQNQMGAGLGGYSISTDSEKYNENQNRLIELTKKLDELESRSSFLEKGLKEKGLLELSGWEELKIAGSKYIDTLKDFKDNIANGEFEEAHDNIKTLQATNAVVLEKVTSGILKIGEYVQDGVAMLKTTGASVITLGIDAVFGTNYTDDMWKSTMDYVAIDQVGNIEKDFYENTSIGKELNDESILKYNSKGAESIKNASKKVGEMVAATAVTVATGGTAAPLVAAGIGFLEGTGQGGEKYFSMTDENGNYTNRNVKGIGLSYLEGIQKGSEWYISGQVGSGIYNGVKSFVNPASITKEVASRATGNTFKDAVVNTIKLPDMYVDFAAATAKAGAGYITNGEVNWKDYAFEMGFAVLGNFGGELLSAAGANKLLKEKGEKSFIELDDITPTIETFDFSKFSEEISPTFSASNIIKDDPSKIRLSNIKKQYAFSDISDELCLSDIKQIKKYGNTLEEALENINKTYGYYSPQAVTARATILQSKIELNPAENFRRVNMFDNNPEELIKKRNSYVNNRVQEVLSIFGEDKKYKLLTTESECELFFRRDIEYWENLKNSSNPLGYVGMKSYTGSDFDFMNPYLREKSDQLSKELKENVTALVSALDKTEISDDLILFRGTNNLDYILKKYGFEAGATKENISQICGGTKIISDNAFLSTTPVFGKGFTNKKVVEVVRVPAGTKGSFLGKHSTYDNECELLLQVGTGNRQILDAVDVIGDQIFVYTTIIP